MTLSGLKPRFPGHSIFDVEHLGSWDQVFDFKQAYLT